MIGGAYSWRCAKQIIDRYGEDAPLEAAMRADAMLEAVVVTHQSLRSDGRMPGLTTAMVRFAGITLPRPRLCS